MANITTNHAITCTNHEKNDDDDDDDNDNDDGWSKSRWWQNSNTKCHLMVVAAVVMTINFYLLYLLRKFARKISIYWQEQYYWQLQAVWMANRRYTRRGQYLDLLIWSDGTENDFCEVLRGEHAETDSTNRLVVLNQS